MPINISYHALSYEDLTKEYLPFLMNKKDDVDSLIRKFIRVQRNRWIANIFGLRLLGLTCDERFIKEPVVVGADPFKGYFKDKSRPEFSNIPYRNHEIQPELFVWGRPFLMTEMDPKLQADVINSYLNAADDLTVLKIIESQVNKVAPGLYKAIHVLGDYREVLHEAQLDDHEVLFTQMKSLADEHRRFIDCATNKKTFIDNDGYELESNDLCKILSNPFRFIQFLSVGSPAWVDRGFLHCSTFSEIAGVSLPSYVKDSSLLLGELKENLLIDNSDDDFAEHELGKVIFPEHVDSFLLYLQKNKVNFEMGLEKQVNLIRKCNYELAFLKLHEALEYCQKTRRIFVESADIFGGHEGALP